MANTPLKIKYGKDLKTANPPVDAGAVYLDTAKNKVYYDDPTGEKLGHTLIGPENIVIADVAASNEKFAVETQTLNGLSADDFLKTASVDVAEADETQPIKINSQGKLVTAVGTGDVSIDSSLGNAGNIDLKDDYVQIAKIGFSNEKETQPVHITAEGKLVTEPSKGGALPHTAIIEPKSTIIDKTPIATLGGFGPNDFIKSKGLSTNLENLTPYNLDIIEQNGQLLAKGADEIIAQGTSGIWTWKKYKSGLAICWGTQIINDISSPNWKSWGSVYSLVLPESDTPLPFAFNQPPIDITVTTSTKLDTWTYNSTFVTTQKTKNTILVRATPGGAVGAHINHLVIGEYV